jgi:hypothetical protein
MARADEQEDSASYLFEPLGKLRTRWPEQGRCQVRVTEVRMALCHLFSMGESTVACSRWREQTSRKTPRAIRSSLLESSEHDGRSKEAPR